MVEARVKQEPVLVLAEELSKARFKQEAVLVLWGIDSSAQVSQLVSQYLSRAPVRRTIGITD